MKFKFKRQPYQTAAVDAVGNCFIGQPLSAGLNYRIDPGRTEQSSQLTMAAMEEMTGFKNGDIALSPKSLLENVQAVQRHQNLPQSQELVKSTVCDINLDVEMETGTGKTY